MYSLWLRVRARLLVISCLFTFVSLVAGFIYYLSFPDLGLEVSYDRVGRVDSDGPAARAGILPGDQILAVNGKSFFSRGEAYISPGNQSAILTLRRDGQPLLITVRLETFSAGTFFRKLGYYLTAFGLWLIGACFLFLRARDSRADLLIACCLLVALFLAVLPFPDFGIDWANRLANVLILTASPMFVQYHSVYPEYKLLAGRRSFVIASLYVVGAILCLARVPFDALTLADIGWLFPLSVLTHSFVVFCMLLGLGLLAHTYWSTTSILARRQAGIMLIGTAVSVPSVSLLIIVPQITRGVYPIPSDFVFLLLLLIPLSYAYATYRHRLMNIDRKVNRTVVLVTLAISLIGVYTIVEETVTRSILELTPALDLHAANWIAVAVVVSLVVPLKDRTQRLVDTAFYGGWYSYRSIIQKLANRLSHVRDIEALTSDLVDGLADDLRIQAVALLLPDIDNRLRVWKSFGFDDSALKATINGDSTLSKYLIQHGEPVEHGQLDTAVKNGAVAARDVDTWHDARLWVPLIREDELEGILILGLKEVEDFFDEEDVTILKTLAQQAAMSIQNLRLIKMLRQQLDEMGRLYRELMRARDEEQHRLARDLHDTVIQELAALSHRLEHYAGDTSKHVLLIESVQDSIHNVLGDLHAMCREIQHTVIVSEVGLVSALQRQVNDIAEESSIQIDLQVPATHEIKRIPRDTQDYLYRICQELLRNVRKHSHAQSVQITLSVPSKQVCLEVRDDGSGFVVPDSLGRLVDNNHFGLAGLQQQVIALGGKVNIESAFDQGTHIQVFLPLEYASTVAAAN